MAKQVERSNPVALLEDAAHLLRQAPLDVMLRHWIGSVPFALGVLLFWDDQSHHNSDARCAAGALILAILLIWMNCWRGVYAGRLHRQLSGAPDRPWDGRRVRNLIAGQSFLAGAKMLLLPISLLAIFPFATTVAFFRNTAVFAGRADLDPLALIAKARRLSKIDKFQCWMLQALILLLTIGVWLNVGVACIILPSLIKILTGYESIFSRSGESFFENRLFLMVTLGLTWLVFDPFLQAVYTLRCFQGDSVETGEDLRAGLRRVRAGESEVEEGSRQTTNNDRLPHVDRNNRRLPQAMVKGAVLLALLEILALPIRAADAVAPSDLQRAVRAAMQSPEYSWRIPPPPQAASNAPWIIQATERALRAIENGIDWVFDHLMRLLRWIFGGLNIGPLPTGGTAPSAALHIGLWLLAAVTVALAGMVIWRALANRKKMAKPAPVKTTVVRLDDEGLTADRLPEEGWIEMAEQARAEGNLRLALRAFYLANLAWLGRQEFIGIHPGKTNREFERELRRRTQANPEAREFFSANVLAFERAWYGLHEVSEENLTDFRRRYDEIKRILSAGLLDKAAGAAA
ncbi:MAG TPA: DUF4129 domain-containing protein [Verrucomicrobiae bacterium]|nr:DUF4129 domain-containing protein [Verrucomicrobiae bacterium]